MDSQERWGYGDGAAPKRDGFRGFTVWRMRLFRAFLFKFFPHFRRERLFQSRSCLHQSHDVSQVLLPLASAALLILICPNLPPEHVGHVRHPHSITQYPPLL